MRASDYTGPRRKLTRLADLAHRAGWVVQPKVDGMWVWIALDERGEVARLTARTGREVPAGDLVGIRLGAPWAVLCGELEAHTPAAVELVSRRGFALCHVHDCVHDGTRSITDRAYGDRRDVMYRMIAEVADRNLGKHWADSRSRPRATARDRATGRFTARVPRSWRRFPIIPQRPASEWRSLWSEYVETGGGEGIVAVNLAAAAGRGKYKLKRTDTADMVAATVEDETVACFWPARGLTAIVPRNGVVCEPGDTVEVVHEGVYPTGLPRFPRILRVRADLVH